MLKEYEASKPDEIQIAREWLRLLKGGNGGYGNEHFKSSTNQNPKETTLGKQGGEANFFIEVEIIADIEEENAGRLGKLLWEQHR